MFEAHIGLFSLFWNVPHFQLFQWPTGQVLFSVRSN